MTRIGARNGIMLLVVVFIVSCILEVFVGAVSIPYSQIPTQTWAYLHGSHTTLAVVIGALRWPRLLVAVFVGAALAVSGAVMQSVLQNAMADPGIIGASGGASLGSVLVICLGLGSIHQWVLPIGAFLASLAAVFVVYRLAAIGGRVATHTLLLAGVAVSAFCSSMVALLLSMAPFETTLQMLFWLMGGLDGSNWQHVMLTGILAIAGLAVFILHADALDIMSIGEEQAEGVGVNLLYVKQIALVVIACIVGGCVSVTGVIGFVGLIVPHFVRLWIGPNHRVLIPASALGGASLLILSDILARTLLAPIELNIGIITSCVGVPFFLYLLRKSHLQFMRG